jgi:zinc protease
MNLRAAIRIVLALWAGTTAFGLAGAATPGVDAPPDPGPPRPVVLPPLAEHTLPNGAKVVIATRRDLPVVTAVLLVRHGAEADPADRAGLAAMTATLMTKGARRGGQSIDATGIARQAEALGASLDSGSGWHQSTLSMTVTTPRLREALALIADVAQQPTLADGELQRARAQTLDGLRVALAQPGAVAGMVARRAYWGDSAYGASPTPQSVQRLTRADVRAFHRHWWRPSEAVLVLTGDVDETAGVALARASIGRWRAGPAPGALRAPSATGSSKPTAPPKGNASAASQGVTPLAAHPLPASLVVVDMPGSGQSGVVVSAPYAAVHDSDRRIGQVAATVLGGGYSARINQEVRIKRGLSYGAGGGGESQPEGGVFTARAQTQNETGVQVLQLLRDELLRLGSEPPNGDELAARQATLVGSFGRQLETTDSLAGVVVRQIALGLPLAALQRYVDEVMAVTPEQVRDFARAHFQPDALRAVLVIDRKAAGDTLKAIDAKALSLSLSELDLERPTLRKR